MDILVCFFIAIKTRRQVLRYKSVTLKYVGHENASYIKSSVFTYSDETSHTLNRNILFIRDKTIRVRNDSLKRCEEIFK